MSEEPAPYIVATDLREIDAKVAESMGWRLTDRRPADISGWSGYPDIWYETPRGRVENAMNVPRYSTDIAAAWLVVEHLRSIGQDVSVEWDNKYQVWFGKIEQGYFDNGGRGEWLYVDEADTAPLAICLVALKATA